MGIEMQIDWEKVRTEFLDYYYEETCGESDYDTYFYFMKKSVNDESLDWDKIEQEYFNYIDETCNENDGDTNFDEFQEIVLSTLEN